MQSEGRWLLDENLPMSLSIPLEISPYSRGGSSPRQKEEMRAVERFSSSFCAVVVQWRQRGPPLNGVPDPSPNCMLKVQEKVIKDKSYK